VNVDLAPRDGWILLPFRKIAQNITERVDDPGASGLDHYVGLEHLDPDTPKISRWGSPSDVEATKLRFYPGDVIYARRRAYQRKLGVAEWDGIASAHALVLRARGDFCLPDFLPYFLQGDQFHHRALDISVGSLSPTINWTTLAEQEFTIPPLDVQRDIVQILASVDELVVALLATIGACAEATDALIGEALFGNDTWPRQPLRTVLERAFAGSWGGEPGTAVIDVPVIRSTEFTNDGIPDVSSPALRAFTAGDFDRLALKPGDVLIEKSGGTEDRPVGRAIEWLDESPAIASNFVHVLRPDASIVVPAVLAAALWQIHRRGGTLPFQTATTNMRNLRMRDYLELPLPVPPIADAERLEEAVRAVRAIWSAAQSHLKRTRLLRRALLTKLLANHHAE
jgi:hypothetical protein